MEKDLWAYLRYWQSSREHIHHRAQMLSLLREPSLCADLPELWRRMQAQGEEFYRPVPSMKEPLWCQSVSEAQRLHKAGVRALTPASAIYPLSLLHTADPPLTLSVKGHLEILHRPGLAVVGSREPSVDSLQWMEDELALFCRKTRAVISSGGARGVDQKAHSVALRNVSPTVIFLPSGILNPYPGGLDRWSSAVLDGGGAMVSEYPPEAPMRKPHFHQRNRLIAASGVAVLIVEARIRSGTLITATRAAEVGRPLWVLPGHPRDSRFAGSLSLVMEGGSLIRHAEDLIIYWQSENENILQQTLAIEEQNTVSPER